MPSDQVAAIEKVRQDIEDIDFSKGVLTYVDVALQNIGKKLIQRLSEEMWHFQVG